MKRKNIVSEIKFEDGYLRYKTLSGTQFYTLASAKKIIDDVPENPRVYSWDEWH